jgi:hypothetical protein
MARYQSIEIVPREIFVIDHEAAMVWTINGVTDEGPVSSARSGSAPRFTVSSRLRRLLPAGDRRRSAKGIVI